MNYQKLYDAIIKKAQNRILPKGTYSERHHIIPKSFGGNNSKENLVRLTAREHFLCHYLLCKIAPINTQKWFSAVKAFNMMVASSKQHQRYVNSRLYESYRNHMSTTMKQFIGKKNSQYNTRWVHYGKKAVKIQLDQLDDYLSQGWVAGRTPPKTFSTVETIIMVKLTPNQLASLEQKFKKGSPRDNINQLIASVAQ